MAQSVAVPTLRLRATVASSTRWLDHGIGTTNSGPTSSDHAFCLCGRFRSSDCDEKVVAICGQLRLRATSSCGLIWLPKLRMTGGLIFRRACPTGDLRIRSAPHSMSPRRSQSAGRQDLDTFEFTAVLRLHRNQLSLSRRVDAPRAMIKTRIREGGARLVVS
jgi:hypothetical protein